jgi:PTH2 family peptidyl-tRNA hydrolase
VIVVRKYLQMRKGKIAAQVAHASMAFITRRLQHDCCNHPLASTVRLSKVEREWLDNSFTKIVLSVNSEQELCAIETAAISAGIETNFITDNGRTEFHGVPTATCVALGPDLAEKIDPITGKLSML